MARPTLDRNPKFKMLIHLLGLPKPVVRGYLETLWDVCNESGNPHFATFDLIEAASEWTGQHGEFSKAMIRAGLIDVTEDGYEVHDFWDHCPEYVRKRKQREDERQRTRNPTDRAAAREALYAEEGFSEFWKAYPRPDDKERAAKEWKRLSKEERAEILTGPGFEGWLQYWRAKDEPEFVPHARTWLHNRRWLVQPPTLRRKNPDMHVGAPEPQQVGWLVNLYRREDLERYGEDPMWDAYLEYCMRLPEPCSAMPFTQWRETGLQ